MKQTLFFLLVLCAAFVGCSTAKAPSAEQIVTALEGEVKKGNPKATVKLKDIKMDAGGKLTQFEFTCTDCLLEDKTTNTKKIVPSATGDGSVHLDPQDGKWKFGAGAFIHSDDGFSDSPDLMNYKF